MKSFSPKSSGFTLIELIIVISIIGILAAFAIPRFVDLQDSARRATLDGVRAAVISAANLAKTQCLASGLSCDVAAASGQSVSIEGQTINLVYGFPSESSIVNALTSSEGVTIDSSSSPTTFTISNCSFSYTEPTGANASPAISAVTCS